MKQDPKSNSVSDDAAIEKLLCEHYKRSGKIIPQTVEDVANAEADDEAHPVILSARLRNPDLFGNGPCTTPTRVLTFPTATNSAAQNLARAAREGGTISPQVEAQMEADRAKAERDADKEDGTSD